MTVMVEGLKSRPDWLTVQDYGKEAYASLVGRAVVILKEDRRLVGLDRLRFALARAAVLRAIGGEVKSFVPPKELWKSGAIPVFCNELVAACALRLKLDGHVVAA